MLLSRARQHDLHKPRTQALVAHMRLQRARHAGAHAHGNPLRLLRLPPAPPKPTTGVRQQHAAFVHARAHTAAICAGVSGGNPGVFARNLTSRASADACGRGLGARTLGGS